VNVLLLIEQTFNGIQLGMMLFLMAVGVSLVFGVMRLVNLAHGSMFMLGAYFAAAGHAWSGSYLVAALISLAGVVAVALVMELIVIRRLYERDHLAQILATFGLILTFNEAVTMLWGKDPVYVQPPELLSGAITILPGVAYPAYRLAITIVAVIAGGGLYWLLTRTRTGMLIRAGADDRRMVAGLGVRVVALNTTVFVLGAALAALAGLLISPLITVQSGLAEPMLILALTVVVIGGIGSIKGALFASLLIGVLDTYGRVYVPLLIGSAAGNALANMLVYVLMALVIIVKPSGLFSQPTARFQ
jgi:branched-chain amino acid transport system permease protein